MSIARGEIFETADQLPFKAVIVVDGEIATEESFPNRWAAQEFIYIAIQRPEQLPRKVHAPELTG
jgi:hypothetical protein